MVNFSGLSGSYDGPSGPPRNNGPYSPYNRDGPQPFNGPLSGPPRDENSPYGYKGPSGPGPSGPSGPLGPSGPPRRPHAPPVNYRNLPSDHPLKWNDEGFYFDHDFKPTRPQERQSESTEGGGHFFDDFTDFYKNPSERSFHNSVGEGQQQVKSFGASDGFPNFFEGNFNY